MKKIVECFVTKKLMGIEISEKESYCCVTVLLILQDIKSVTSDLKSSPKKSQGGRVICK